MATFKAVKSGVAAACTLRTQAEAGEWLKAESQYELHGKKTVKKERGRKAGTQAGRQTDLPQIKLHNQQ